MTQPRILIMSLIFPPDGVSTAQLLGEIANDLRASGSAVSVITTSPHYNEDSLAIDAQPISWRWHSLVGHSRFGDIDVIHLRMPKKARSALPRIAQWIWFHLGSIVIALKQRNGFDTIFTVSPPPTVALVAGILKRVTRTRLVYAVWELYPEILVKLGHVQRGSRVHRLLTRVERVTYEQADVITVLHEPMRHAVLGVSKDAAPKTHVVPTFADTSFLKPSDRMTDLRHDQGIGDSFVFGYAGNLGTSEDLTASILAAPLIPDATMLICGDGTERRRLEALCESEDIHNVLFTGHLPYERVPEIFASFDVSMVVLTEGVDAEALPSKTYQIMACGRPILAVTTEGSPLAKLVRDLEIGDVVPPGDAMAIRDALAHMRANPTELAGMGRRARAAAESTFSREVVSARYLSLIRQEAGRDGAR